MVVLNNSICAFCSVSCATCLSSSNSSCTSCYTGDFLNTNTQTCSSVCPTNYYTDSSSGTGLCAPCQPPCLACASLNYCLSCIDTSLFVVSGACLGCTVPCLSCSGLRTNCTACNTSSNYPYLFGGTCNSACLLSDYGDAGYQCQPCLSPCGSCSNGSVSSCLSCISGYYQLGSSCFAICPSSYYPSVTICSSCLVPCATCSSASVCLSCTAGWYL